MISPLKKKKPEELTSFSNFKRHLKSGKNYSSYLSAPKKKKSKKGKVLSPSKPDPLAIEDFESEFEKGIEKPLAINEADLDDLELSLNAL